MTSDLIPNELILFVSTYGTVFALGFQSLNVNNGHYVAAFVTSLTIGACNLVVLKMVPSTVSASELMAYMAGGPLGIVSSMWCHGKILGRRRRQASQASEAKTSHY